MKQPHPFHSNKFGQQRNYKRFIIYFIVFVVLYQGTKFIYKRAHAKNNNTITQPLTKVTDKKRSSLYKKQTILHYKKDEATYNDFPWYKQEHTRPQFRPNTSLTTTDLSIKEREIMLQKAVLTAKKLALKRFSPEDYTGIRGTKLVTREETLAFRSRVECMTKGQWVRNEQTDIKKAPFQLKHIQDPIYSTCDKKFYKTHEKDEKRESIKYRWKPTNSAQCPIRNTIDTKNWCKVLKGRNMLLVGDLTHYQYHELLLDTFRDEPTVCFGELNCKDHTICKGKDTRLRYVRNDILSTIRKFQNRDQGHPLANIVEWPFVTSNMLSSYPILLLSRTALLGDDDLSFTRRLIQTMRVIRETSPDALVIYKSSFIGHPFCDDATQPLQTDLTDEELKRLPYGWSETKRRNAIAKAVIESAGGIYLDLASMVDKRPDGHLGGSDCLRYCIPGPLDATMQVLYHVFLALEN